jgi:hypothetical protein
MVDLVVNKHIQYHLDVLTDKKALIVVLPDLISNYRLHYPYKDSELNVDLKYINTYADDYDVILIDYTTNYVRHELEETIYRLLSQYVLPKPWFIITSNFKYYNSQHSHIIYYPIYAIDGLDLNRTTNIEIKDQRSHNICFLTYHYHLHRILIMLELYTQTNFESCLINLPKFDSINDSCRQSLNNSLPYLTTAERQLVNDMFKLAPLFADTADLQENIVNLNNRAFSNSYINIFTESDHPRPWVTEKSIKPFLSGQFFAVFGHPNAYVHLKELGFDLFEDYIPMPQHQDFRQNLKELMNIIIDLIPKIQSVWDDTYDRRLHNYRLARSPELRDRLCCGLITGLNSI